MCTLPCVCVRVCVCTISRGIQRAQVLELLQYFVFDSLQFGRLVSQLQDVHEGFVVAAGVSDLHTSTQGTYIQNTYVNMSARHTRMHRYMPTRTTGHVLNPLEPESHNPETQHETTSTPAFAALSLRSQNGGIVHSELQKMSRMFKYVRSWRKAMLRMQENTIHVP